MAPVKTSDWLQTLARYREPNRVRSVIEIAVTIVPFVLLWIAAWLALSVSYILTLAIAVPAAGFLVRLFLIQHDCGHGSFFGKKWIDDWVGRVLGVFTFTAYEVWRRSHSIHHASSGNLDARGIGDIDTLTVREYQALPTWRKAVYRAYRHPLILFGIGPTVLFIIANRFPATMLKNGRRYWVSAMGTNLAILVLGGAISYAVGPKAFFMVHVPIIAMAASIGVWLFYVQHQFEHTVWADTSQWNQHDAALYGSSHYDLPPVLRWMTANIGIHHVHHLYSRIPFYRLPEVLRDHPVLGDVHRVTLWESFACARLRLWDEQKRTLVSFAEARAIQQ